MEELKMKIYKQLTEVSGRWGVVVQAADGTERLEINPHMSFPAASMIKLPIMYEVMRQVADGRLSLEDLYVVDSSHCVGGAGILQELRRGIGMSVRELIKLMIVVSDNTATNMLIELAGMDAINACLKELGLHGTVLRRRMMDFAAAQQGAENLTTAADMASMLQLINSGTELSQEYRDFMLDTLKRQQVRDKLPFYLPEDVVIANKTGTLSCVEHDGGILYLPAGDYIIAVMTADLAANYQGLQLVANIGRTIYEHVSGRRMP